jgi:phosphoglycolate phosphatase
VTVERPRTLLFDWDNTLVDTWPAIHAALSTTFEAMGETPWTFEQTRARVRRSAREAFPELFGARAEEAARIFYAAFEASHLHRLRACPGAQALLASLAGEGYDLAVVSNKHGPYLRREAEQLGWAGYFRRLVGAGDANYGVPRTRRGIAVEIDYGTAERAVTLFGPDWGDL